MRMTEILGELAKLKAEERHTLFEKLEALEWEKSEESAEMLAAIDEGIRSAETERSYTVVEVRAEIPTWFTKSS
jgi:predicted transcriptional regulator